MIQIVLTNADEVSQLMDTRAYVAMVQTETH
jgi:hypothetical protein